MKKLFIILLMSIFLISFASAADWDNGLKYENNDMKVIIENWAWVPFFGDDLGTAELKSHKSVNHILEVAPGENRTVMYYDINFNEFYENGLGDVEFINMKDGEIIQKDYHFVVWDLITETKNNYTLECVEVYSSFNNTYYDSCENVLVGTYEEEIYGWKELDTQDIPKGNIRIGLATDVNTGDIIDGIWEIAGKKIKKHAVWTADLNVGLVSYFKFDENAANTIVLDSHGSNNGTSSTNTNNLYDASGKIESAFDFTSASSEWINLGSTQNYFTNTDFSVSLWVKLDNAGTFQYLLEQGTGGVIGSQTLIRRWDDNKFAINFWGDELKTTSTFSATNTWYHIVGTFDKETKNRTLYVDGNLEGNDISLSVPSLTGDLHIANRVTNTNYLDGVLDEIGIWSRVLNQTEITLLSQAPPYIQNISIILNSPINDFKTTNPSIDFNTTVTEASTEIATVYLLIDGIINQTNNSGYSGNYIFSQTFNTGSYNWSIRVLDNESNIIESGQRNFTIDIRPPQIIVESPNGTLDYNYIGGNETLNVTFADDSLDSCWYNYNGTNVSIDGCVNNTKNSTNFILEQDSLNMTIYANDTFGNLNSTFIEWGYILFETNQTFNNITAEGATETFSIKLIKNSSLQVSMVSLVYNGTTNSFPYLVSGNNITSESSIAIPITDSDVNVSFYWNITLDDGSYILTNINNQTILSVNVDDCSSYNNLIYNLTQYDEEDQSILSSNNTIELQINLYDDRKTVLLTNFSTEVFGVNPVQFCSEDPLLLNVSYSSYVIVKYFANSSGNTLSHAIEYYNIMNQSISNDTSPINIRLYSLKQNDTTKFRLTFRDDEYVLAPNILVQVHRQYIKDNDFKIVEIPITDSNGQTILNLVKDNVVYNFIMTNEANEIVGTFNSIKAFCQDSIIGDCTINLAPDSLSEDIYDYNEEFDISISDPSYDNSTQKISISFITGDLKSKSVSMQIVRNNDFGNRSVCSDSLFAASGILSCDVSAITDTDQFLFISTFVEDDLAKQDTTNLNSDVLNFGTLNGAFYAFLFILFLITMFMEDRKVLVVSLGLGWVGVISLGLVNGKFIGFTSAGIWIIVSIAIFLWKLNSEESA